MNIEVNANELQEFLSDSKSKIKYASQYIINDLADYALDKIRQNYSKAEYQAGETMDFVKTGTETEKTVSMVGPQAWYSEFGTGTRGEQQQHLMKSNFALKPYNSGPTIRPASEKVAQKEKAIEAGITPGTLYWTYKAPDGEIYYTQGIPAQNEVYDAGISVRKKMPSIIKQYMGEMFQ